MHEDVPVLLPHLHGVLPWVPHDHVAIFIENPPPCETIAIIAAKVTSVILAMIALAATSFCLINNLAIPLCEAGIRAGFAIGGAASGISFAATLPLTFGFPRIMCERTRHNGRDCEGYLIVAAFICAVCGLGGAFIGWITRPERFLGPLERAYLLSL
jgi:hypothetical protein